MIEGGIAPIYFAAFFSALVFFIFWNGKTQFFERIMMPPPIDIIKGLVPSVPKVTSGSGSGPLLVIASMVGTTVFSGLFIIRTTLVKEAGWTIGDERTQRRPDVCHQRSRDGRCCGHIICRRLRTVTRFTNDRITGTVSRNLCDVYLCLRHRRGGGVVPIS